VATATNNADGEDQGEDAEFSNTPPSQQARGSIKAEGGGDDGGDKNSKTTTKKKPFQIVRRGVADWKGMLVAYEVFNWFKNLEYRG
jgi:hypothetical protein